jgi:hypothetical protein
LKNVIRLIPEKRSRIAERKMQPGNNLEFNFDGGDPIAVNAKQGKCHVFKLSRDQILKLLSVGLTLADCEAMILRDIPNAKTLKICFSEKEVLDWIQKRYPKLLSIDEVFEWWQSHAKPEYMRPSMSGLYVHYRELRARGKPLRMYKEMCADNKPHIVY